MFVVVLSMNKYFFLSQFFNYLAIRQSGSVSFCLPTFKPLLVEGPLLLFIFSWSKEGRCSTRRISNNDITILTSSPNFQIFLFFPFFLRARQADAAQGEDFGECKGEDNEGQAELKMSKLLHISNLCSEILPIIVKNKLKIMTFCNSEVNPLQYDSAVENVRMSVRIWTSSERRCR